VVVSHEVKPVRLAAHLVGDDVRARPIEDRPLPLLPLVVVSVLEVVALPGRSL
jgi:hypothetical protein